RSIHEQRFPRSKGWLSGAYEGHCDTDRQGRGIAEHKTGAVGHVAFLHQPRHRTDGAVQTVVEGIGGRWLQPGLWTLAKQASNDDLFGDQSSVHNEVRRDVEGRIEGVLSLVSEQSKPTHSGAHRGGSR